MTLNELVEGFNEDNLDPNAPMIFRIFRDDSIVDMEIDEVSEGVDDDICIYLSESRLW